MKKTLLIIIDALSSDVVERALQENRLPHLREIHDAAEYRGESIAVFPSITPAATASLITGRYPVSHGISGAYWYIPDEHKVVYFGYDVWAALEEGIDKYIRDFVLELNEEHLRSSTLFDMLDSRGFSTASLNYLLYHGDYQHELELPGPLNAIRDAVMDIITDDGQEAVVNGPQLHYFGDVIQTPLPNGNELSAPGGPTNRFGISDKTTIALLQGLIDEDALPDMTVAYFPDNDVQSHEVGPQAAVETLFDLDEGLGHVFSRFGGIERMLEELTVIVTGDHSQSNVLDSSRNPGIELSELLESFSIADPGSPMDAENDLVVCPNLRSAQVYFHTPTENRLERATQSLLVDERVDQVMWSADVLGNPLDGVRISTRDRGRLYFKPGRDESMESAEDVYGNSWSWQGQLSTVDASIEDGVITYGDYPNAFERVAGVLRLPLSGHLWMTSKPGYEFCLESTVIHAGGGSHGSLHILDSVSPLWIAGAEVRPSIPEQPRAVDVVPICLAQFGIEPEGAMRA